MKRFKHLLVVAAEDDVATVSLINSAVDLARRNSATISILSVIDKAAVRRGFGRAKPIGPDLRNALIRSRLEGLKEMTRGIDCTVDYQVVEGIPYRKVLEQVAVQGHDLVLIAEAPRSRWGGWQSSATATQLLRKCPVPVWVHSPLTATNEAIAVAIGPVGIDERTEDLNVKLLELAGSMAKIQDSRLHVIHAWRLEGDSMLSGRRLSYPWAEIEAMAKKLVTEARAEIDWLINRAGLDRSELSLHIRNGHTVDVLTETIQDINPSAVVMGTLARTGVPGMIIGNTAERVIGAVNRTVLAVKPDGFGVREDRSDLEWDPAMLPY